MSTQHIITETVLSAEEANALPHEDALRGITWHNVTADLRRAFIDEKYEENLAKIEKARKGKVKKENIINATQREKARAQAQGQWTAHNYTLVEHNGYRNPLQDDMEWGPNREDAKAETQDYKPNKYGGRCPNCDQWVEEQAGKLVKLPTGKWGAEHLTCPEASQDVKTSSQGLDLSEIPSGYYAVPGGDTRLKVRIAHGKNKWEGFTFVTDGAEYGNQKRYGMQRPGQSYKGDITAELEKIAADPKAAVQEYGKLVGRCGRCNAVLEDEDSVARGIGPICASYF